ncbi:metal ABC transporter ATP-binding protein [Desulfohalobium retbaense]|uniref:ABC transporter related protein n=1 Tax=Desulfohalobium retbaense (strain ATCC 49708 / DSM 5692 / JCM 16813 / HR100) TaxID=485915 RepID=C8WZ53_DESRD|nr:metal ABC transporter ATP-binding protein [Desulfohalobium retbaense]ACV67328.1 ABC transporter related protein [Desulfohalobium retbaense DSM 5692]
MRHASSPKPPEVRDSQVVADIQGVDFAYTNGPKVLENVSLRILQGQYLAVLGPNGGGKTTLIKILLGLLKPQQGQISVFGQTPAQARPRIGYLPQYAENRDDFPVSVLDTVLMGVRTKKRWGMRYSAREREKALQSLEEVGLSGYTDRLLGHLSGGERQRVFIARALAADPELLILDEPTSNIDPQAKFCFYEFLAELKASVSIIVVSHDLSITTAHIDSIACVNKTLLYNARPEVTQEMFDLLYGMHERHTCPMAGFGPSHPGFLNRLQPRS